MLQHYGNSRRKSEATLSSSSLLFACNILRFNYLYCTYNFVLHIAENM